MNVITPNPPQKAPMKAGNGGRQKKKSNRLKITFLTLATVFMTLFMAGCFLMYGPFPFFRELWVNTAMETMKHQWLAGVFFDQKTIAAIRKKAEVVAPMKETNPSLVTNNSKVPKDNATELPTKPEDGEHIIGGVGFTKLHGDYGNGWLIKVYDPSKVSLGISKDYGTHGEHVSDMTTRLGMLAGINAGGFMDPGGEGYGGTPDQILIHNSKELQGPTSGTDSHHMIGITYDHKLVLGTYTNSELLKQNFQYGVEFWPFIIMNGEPLDYGYNSYQPRTAIGQTKDGTFIFVVIDGRLAGGSRGASLLEVQKIMIDNNAYNAANLDGGSSTVFAYKGKVINTPSTPVGERWVPDAFMIAATESSSNKSSSK